MEQWEGGGRYLFGRWRKPVKPGVWAVVPWFMDVKVCSQAEMIIVGDRQDITIQDSSVVSYQATAVIGVVDPFLAINAVETFQDTIKELLEVISAEKLSEVDAQRLTPEKRPRLLADLKRWVSEPAKAYGIEVRKVAFKSFVLNTRVQRFILDPSPLPKAPEP